MNYFFWYLSINLCHVQTHFDCWHCVKVFKKLKRVWLNQTSIDIYKWMISLLKYICLIIYKIYAWNKSKKPPKINAWTPFHCFKSINPMQNIVYTLSWFKWRHCSLTRHITNLYVQVPDIMQKPFKKLLCIKTLQILSIASKIISIVNSKKLHLIKQIHIEVLFLQIVIIDIFNFHKISIRDSARDQYIDVRGLKELDI